MADSLELYRVTLLAGDSADAERLEDYCWERSAEREVTVHVSVARRVWEHRAHQYRAAAQAAIDAAERYDVDGCIVLRVELVGVVEMGR